MGHARHLILSSVKYLGLPFASPVAAVLVCWSITDLSRVLHPQLLDLGHGSLDLQDGPVTAYWAVLYQWTSFLWSAVGSSAVSSSEQPS